MQAPKDSFKHSNTTLNSDRGFEDEHQALVDGQKMCKDRARRFSLETNRRRKAQEDRRKQWDVQEQRLKDNILQQRKQKVQDATERFQKGHLPPSQRRRQAFRKGSPNIEDALNHIQGNLSPYARQSAFLSSNSNISRGCTPPPKPPPKPPPAPYSYQRTMSAVEAYTKLIQERSLNTFKNSQLIFLNELQESSLCENPSSSPQGQQINPLSNSESLSSLDSLENEDLNQKTVDQRCTSNSLLGQDSKMPITVSKKQNDLRSSYDLSLSKSGLGDINVVQQKQPKLLFLSPEPRREEVSEEIIKRVHGSPQTTRGPVSVEQSSKTESQAYSRYQSTLFKIIDAVNEHSAESSQENSPRNQVRVAAEERILVSTLLQYDCSPQEGKLDQSRQQRRIQEDVYPKHPAATEIVLPPKNSTDKDNLREASSKSGNVLVSNITVSAALHVEGTDNTDTQSPKPKHSNEPMNDLDKGSNFDPKPERSKNTECLHQVGASNIQSDIPKGLGEESQVLHTAATSSKSDSKINEVSSIKGILKKPSNHVQGDCRYKYTSGHLIFTKPIALSIRDSIELTRTKAKSGEPSKTVKKKLRWIDEASTDEDNKEPSTHPITKPGQIKINIPYPATVDQQPSLTGVSGPPKVAPGVTSPASNAYHFTKQAWVDVRAQDVRLQERTEDVKVQLGSSASSGSSSSRATNGPRGPRRVRSARVGAGPVSSRARKGTVIRPQSASEANHTAMSQVKVMIPRPPPRTQQGNAREAPHGVQNSSGNHSQAQPFHSQGLYRDKTDSYTSPYALPVGKVSGNSFFITEPPSCAYPSHEGTSTKGASATKGDTSTKGGTATEEGTSSSGYQEVWAGGIGRPRQVCNEKGVCLDKTPTDEEISLLWSGVRSALATKDGDPRSSPVQNGSSSAMPQTPANVPQFTIDGDSLTSAVKSEKITRMSGFLPSSNARTLRRQSGESNGTRRRGSAELSRPSSSTEANRRLPYATSQVPLQITPFTSRFDLTNRYEGPESAMAMAAQFQLLAETHSQGSGAASALLTGQAPRKPGQGADSSSGWVYLQQELQRKLNSVPMQHHQQQQGHTALSLEEQKILLSLDKLNHRLHCMQDHVGGSSAPKADVMFDTTITGEGRTPSHRKPRALSADSRMQTKRRY